MWSVTAIYCNVNRPGTVAETLGSGDTGCGTEENRHGITDEAGTWHCRTHVMNNNIMVS